MAAQNFIKVTPFLIFSRQPIRLQKYMPFEEWKESTLKLSYKDITTCKPKHTVKKLISDLLLQLVLQ